MNILVVEDEVRLADAISQIMKESKYSVDAVYDGEDGLAYAMNGAYDAIVLDVMLPKRDGFSVARELRLKGITTPIIMLTARDEIPQRVKGLDSGADDYMTKPFAPEELLARIRALTRRQGEVIFEEMHYEDITLKLSTYDLCRGEKCVHLGYKEFEVLRMLIANASCIVQKEDLIVKIWGIDSNAEDNNVEAYISFLRKKLNFLGSYVGIGNIRKVGYRLEGTKQ